MRPSLAAVALLAPLLAAAPAPVSAAVRDDVAAAEADGSEIAVWGKSVAWRDGARVVVRRADGTQRAFTAGRGAAEGLTVGPDAGGRLVAVFPVCASARSCRLRKIGRAHV